MNYPIQFLIGWPARIVFGGIFVYAGSSKIVDLQEFSDAIAGFSILPISLINITALTLPVIEILLGVMLFVNMKNVLRVGALGMIVLNLIFLGVLSTALLRGINIDCGCFGSDMRVPTAWKIPLALLRNLIFLGFAVIFWLGARRFVVIDPTRPISRKGDAPVIWETSHLVGDTESNVI